MPYETGRESVRALAVLEQQERDRAERASREMIRLRLQAAALERQLEGIILLVGPMRRFAELHGIDWSAPSTRRVAQRAILEAKAEAERTGIGQ
ncbi:hypothetical protein Lesp02_03420 [Lentzea sp. NBRC 105346]|uniref:hypothetical protein n=1 Tax=Lentzea sp. NBRC 105346 TaxID=3032205 RepID=UPI0024A072D6|nr:hypothetical protein [Lentzea sp. NBRC 105346]GLZ28152.1 hypothetical protein Lesp02_03420 [Lentzea sp. NBRC 105346]